jgi:hypothetical protein
MRPHAASAVRAEFAGQPSILKYFQNALRQTVRVIRLN